MTNEISTQQKVVITRNGSTFYVSLDRADKLQLLLLSPNKPDYIELDDTLIAIREITMIAPASKVEDLNKRKQGQWQCQHGHWHTREESICKRNWGITRATKSTPKKLSEEEKARGSRIKELLDAGHSLREAMSMVRSETEDQS